MWTVTLDSRTLLPLALAAVGITSLAYSLGSGVEAADAARRAPRTTHIGANVDDMVTLRLIDTSTTPKFVRVDIDGTQETSEFAVPEGRVLVVTDVDHCIEQNINSNIAILRLRLQNKSETSDIAPVYIAASSVLGQGSTGSGGTKNYGGSSGLLTGFVVGSDARIVADLVRGFDLRKSATEAFNRTAVDVVLRGYLTSAP